ncbi:coiled-coil domain-containing protein 171, partial [Genypterus blacodes]|uniref:coiled-coil domain-containing protein 171 n=1 Tax=Genypterus blacodes TaxID=154954 RepID=UPI003F76E42D
GEWAEKGVTRGGEGKNERRRRRAASEGGERSEESEKLLWKINQLEKEKLELTSVHNQELCGLQAEHARLRAAVERGEAQRVELQYQLTVSGRDADRVAELSRDKHALTDRVEELQQTAQVLQKSLEITRQAREENQHALQQEVEERDRVVQSITTENERLRQLLQEQEEALEGLEGKMKEVQLEKEKEAKVSIQQARELKYLEEREERRGREKELSDQKVKSLESNLGVERAAHLESKFNSEVIQLRVRDLEAALVVERSGQQEAQSSLDLLRAQFREVERAYCLERERSGSTQHALERYEQCKSDLRAALEAERKTTSDLTDRLEEEKRRHADTHLLLEKADKRHSDLEKAHMSCMKEISEILQQQCNTGCHSPAKDNGNQSPCAVILELLMSTLGGYRSRLEETDKKLRDLLFASERLEEQNTTLRQLSSDCRRQTQQVEQLLAGLSEEATRLRQENSDWSTKSRSLGAEMEREREERAREREERAREREERVREREREGLERAAEVQRITEHYQEESKARLSFLYSLYQRLLAGCVLLAEPPSILGNFTWKELCDVITEQADRLSSDLGKAEDKIAHLQSVCEKRSVCVQELQRSQECVLSRLEESVRRREEAWSVQHTQTVTQLQNQLQLCRSRCDSLQDHVSSLELDCSSLTSNLNKLQDLLVRSRRKSSSFLSACALLAGALSHTHRRAHTLSQQKTLLSRWLDEREALEEEVRRLACALEGEEEEEEEEKGRRRRMAVRKWRRSICAVLAVLRWRSLAKRSAVLFRLERGAISVFDCREATTATRKGQSAQSTDKNSDDVGDGDRREGACIRWLHSKRLTSAILSSMADLHVALAGTGSSPTAVMSAARSGLSRLLEHLLDQSDSPSGVTPVSRMKPRPTMKAWVSTLQQHFLLFSQRLHSTEVERRSLRLEVANLRRAARAEEACSMVPAERFHTVCLEFRQALSREQEAQALLRQQNTQLHTLQLRASTHTAEGTNTQHTLSQTAQSLSEARQEVSKKERSLKILAKHLSGIQRERKQLEERQQRAEGELRDANRRMDCLVNFMKAAETSCKEVRDSLIQSRRFPLAQPPLVLLPKMHLEPSGAESIVGAPEVAVCQSLFSTFSQLYQTCSSRIDWLEQEDAAHRSHVTALRGELQDVCLRDSPPYVSVDGLPRASSLVEVDRPPPSVPMSDLCKDETGTLSTAPSQPIPASSGSNPTPSRPLSKPARGKTKERRVVKKSRGHVRR